MIGYSLILAMNYLPGMAVITLNVIGDAATNVIVNFKEGKLNKEQYNSKTPVSVESESTPAETELDAE